MKTKLPIFSFPKGKKGERTPSPDRKKSLNVSLKLTKKGARQVAILPEHDVTEGQIRKEFELTRVGPATYEVTHDLVEPRQDKGVPIIVAPPTAVS